jgi:hypothetical protein
MALEHSEHYIHPIPSSLGVNIYLDESGDLAYPGRSKFFVFGAVIVKTCDDDKCCVTRIRRANKKIQKFYKFNEIKSSQLHGYCREVVVKEIMKGSYDFAYSLLRKDDVIDKSKFLDKSSLYNWIAAKLVEDIIGKYNFKSDVNIIIDKSLYGIQQKEFDTTLLHRNSDKFYYLKNLDAKIFHCDSKTECGIQIADMIAGTVYHHYTRHERKPYSDGNFFPRICEKTTVALDFFKGRRK